MLHVCIAHCMPEKIHKMSQCENSCLFVWSTVVDLFVVPLPFYTYLLVFTCGVGSNWRS